MSKGCAVYRYFTASGELLYVGITIEPDVRYMTHYKLAAWPRFTSRITEHWYPSVAEATAVEAAAIWAERPLFNSRHAGPRRNERILKFLIDREAYDVMDRVSW